MYSNQYARRVTDFLLRTSGLILTILLSACASPAQRFHEEALLLGLQPQQISTSLFKHQLYFKAGSPSEHRIHVYLDGDGTPWHRHRWIATDPTARNPLILRLMAQDTAPALLLGRPCYYGLTADLSCHSQYWTSHRYAKTVVDSMSVALRLWLTTTHFNEVVLIGYSGGGALALLIAPSVSQVSEVVTVAANLDVSAWSTYHGYLPLTDSLNPADSIHQLPASIKQIHLAGAKDTIVPSFIIQHYAESQSTARYYQFSDQNHACCWEYIWKDILPLLD